MGDFPLIGDNYLTSETLSILTPTTSYLHIYRSTI